MKPAMVVFSLPIFLGMLLPGVGCGQVSLEAKKAVQQLLIRGRQFESDLGSFKDKELQEKVAAPFFIGIHSVKQP